MDNTIKIYIHHSWDKSLFYKLFHNSTNINVEKNENTTFVKCNYKNLNLFLIFDTEIHDNPDGLHLIDWFSKYYEMQKENYSLLHSKQQTHDYLVISEINKLIKDKSGWIVSILRTEKIYSFNYEAGNMYDKSHEPILKNICKNHTVVTDNFYLMDVSAEIKFHHVLTNTLFQWNQNINIRWFYEFKSIFTKLNFDYDIGLSVRHIKPNRLYILDELSKLNNDRIFLQVSDFTYNSPDNDLFKENDLNSIQYDNNRIYGYDHVQNFKKNNSNIRVNEVVNKTHFGDLSILTNGFSNGLDYDLFFRYLSKSKIQILDESWGYFKGNFSIQYLSEKTLGYILAEVPFISTNIYPIDYLQNSLDIDEYPFYQDVVNFNFDKKNIIKFIEDFLKNYDEKYDLLKKWTSQIHLKYIEKINTENSLLDLIKTNFKEPTYTIKQKSLL